MRRMLALYILPVSIGILATGQLDAQPSRLLNSSFEGEPRDASVPRGWHPCQEGTTPDILPGPWGVYTEPYDGKTYVGLITRENGTWESIGQKLITPLKADDCYYFSCMLARSDAYMGYDNPVKLRVWGGKGKCDRDVLIQETPFIEHTEWQRYTFEFPADQKVRYIILEAFYEEEEFSHPGNILIDDITAIRRCGRS